MTSKKAISLEKRQLEDFKILMNIVIDKKVDVLIIAGNLFGTARPKNQNIKIVNELLKQLSDSNIITLILPGVHDTPLYFSNDNPVHFIFQNIKNVHILQDNDYSSRIKHEIDEPVFRGNIKNETIQIFTTTTPFIKPEELKFNLDIAEGYSNWFIISDIYSFKKDVELIYKEFLNELRNTKINALLIGGVIPNIQNTKQRDNDQFQVIHCPPIQLHHFEHGNREKGLTIHSFEDNNFTNKELINISEISLHHKKININDYLISELNEELERQIKENADTRDKLCRVSLHGEIDKEDYHSIRIFDLIDKGNRLYFYFELKDLIRFDSGIEAVEGLDILKSLKEFTKTKIDEIQNNINMNSDLKEQEIKYLNKAIELIEKEWREEGKIQ